MLVEKLRQILDGNSYQIARKITGHGPPHREYNAVQRRWNRLQREGSVLLTWLEADLRKLGYKLILVHKDYPEE